MNIFKKKIKEKGYKKNFISNELEITYKTLQNWTSYKKIKNNIKFLKLIKLLDIDINKIILEYEDIKKQKNNARR